ncbi:hypothetical protein LJ737_26800 [Hymenobacter sp. 15J16-1T3B]|uniref:hypothetical protein n=1 Tax=Hymenobacter sp. 15J16-1T3B TaxID=2886941 RepID=UPI001D10A4E3|nr:hypothetical protein [Hymenobacter sp. 15J16-1T3B]MCC3160871.1 hypothetical protein [Hymenobacter sp. 15J16-1T3B]
MNENFIEPIASAFFLELGGVDKFDELDVDKIVTEIDYEENIIFNSFVNEYLYKEIFSKIEKDSDNTVRFKPRYVMTFDRDLASYEQSKAVYPCNIKRRITYGTISIGGAVVLYYIYVDLQDLIRFLKKARIAPIAPDLSKVGETVEERYVRLFEEVIVKKQLRLNDVIDQNEKTEISNDISRLLLLKKDGLKGEKGKLRVNLSWETTDDLDIHISLPNGEIINFKNKVVEYGCVIGELDVDKNAGNDIVSNPQENVNWNEIPLGRHKVSVDFFNSRDKRKVSFTLSIFSEYGEGRVYNSYVEHEGEHKTRGVLFFNFINGELICDDLV